MRNAGANIKNKIISGYLENEHMKPQTKSSDINVLLNRIELNKKSESITLTKEIINSIDSIIDKNDEIKNSASKRLNDIRIKIKIIKSKISQTFNSSLNLYLSRDLLDEIKETTIENRRVLAVKSMFRKKVKGQIMGRSKTGSIIYIEPENTLKYSRELITLLID